MSESVQELLNSFDRLPQAEQMIVLTEILKRAGELDYPPEHKRFFLKKRLTQGSGAAG